MAEEQKPRLRLEIAHVLFVDIVGYSKLLISEQSELLEHFKEMVRGSEMPPGIVICPLLVIVSFITRSNSRKELNSDSSLPDISDPIAGPPRRHNFLLCVKLHTFFSLDVQVAVKRLVPAGKRKHRHRRRHAHVDADHPGFHAVLELTRRFS